MTHSPDALRLHGAGDGSVMAYCGTCRNPLPSLPRPATLAAVHEAWTQHRREQDAPVTGLGHVQRAVLLMLANGNACSVTRIESDMLMSAGRVRGALEGLSRRGLVARDHTSGDRSGDRSIQWSLTDEGMALARKVHGLDDDDEGPRCPHGTPAGWPCKGCRLGPWRCDDCGEVVRGGYRSLHRFDAHGEQRGQRTRITFTWAGGS